MLAYCAIIYGGMSIYYTHRNNRRAAGLENHTIEGMSEEEIAELGDESWVLHLGCSFSGLLTFFLQTFVYIHEVKPVSICIRWV
jgi:hypothetical protein